MIFGGEDRDLYLHVGYFFNWYNQVEWKITVIMAVVMGERDLVAFDQLVRGMGCGDKSSETQRYLQNQEAAD